jgi:hypothetical protein
LTLLLMVLLLLILMRASVLTSRNVIQSLTPRADVGWIPFRAGLKISEIFHPFFFFGQPFLVMIWPRNYFVL